MTRWIWRNRQLTPLGLWSLIVFWALVLVGCAAVWILSPEWIQ